MQAGKLPERICMKFLSARVDARNVGPALKGALILVIGAAWFFAVFIPQPAILRMMNTDALTALYLILEHGVLDACFIIAAFSFLTAALSRTATPLDMGLVQFPFFEERPASRWSRLLLGTLYLIATLAIIVVAAFLLLLVQGRWEIVLHDGFHLPVPVNDWGLPDLLRHKPISFGVEIFVLCLLAPCAEEFLFRGFLFQWLASRFGVFPGVLLSSLIFMAIHWSLFGAANTFLLGVFAALLLRASRSLWPGVALHALWNLLFVLSAVGVLR
jgi:membrane protease YdiL (CAAX protease family)